MKTAPQPLKRSIALRPFSHDHHDTLLFVWKVRQGINKTISLPRIANYCSWYWQTHLQAHMLLEEATLTKVLPADNALIRSMLDEHAAIKAKMEEASKDPTYPSLESLCNLIYDHVRFEERVLFPGIETAASDDQMEDLRKQVIATPHLSEWPDSFWLKP